MRKIFVLDTNVLIHDPHCIKNFKDNEVIIPLCVIEEIDTLKRIALVSANARMVSRIIDKFREKGNLYDGVDLENKIFFRIETESDIGLLPPSFSNSNVDNKILSTTLFIKRKYPDKRVIMVTKDVNMRIKADSLQIEVEDYKTGRVEFSLLNRGFIDIDIDDDLMKKYKKGSSIPLSNLTFPKEDLTPNTFFKLRCNSKVMIGRNINGKVSKLLDDDPTVWGLKAINTEQKFALELLLDDNIKVVSLVGSAGTGKTLLAISSALEQVVEKKKYKKILIARPIIPMGKDLGYLPGDEKEKMKPWMQPIYDNIDFLCDNKESRSSEKVIEGLETMGLLKIEPLTYIRGRSISNSFIIIDESQNLTPLEIKTIVTRVGKNSKIVFTGDPTQIDNIYLDANTNGFTYMAERLKNEKIVGNIMLVKGERSEISEVTTKLL